MIYFDYRNRDYILMSDIRKKFNINIQHRIASIKTIYKTNPNFERIRQIFNLRYNVYKINIIPLVDVCSLFKNYYRDKYFDLLSELNHPSFTAELEKESIIRKYWN